MIRLPQLDLVKLKAKAVKWGLVVLALLAYGYGAYFYGKAVVKAEYEREVAKVLEKEVKSARKTGAENAAKGERVGRQTAEMDARVNRALEDLNEAIEKARSDGSTSCDLTADELRALEAIYNSYGK